MHNAKSRGFAPAELLVVTAIVAVLTVIAIPNYRRAVVQADIAEVRSEMQALGLGLEAYRTDWGSYPACLPSGDPVGSPSGGFSEFVLERLTTPVAYVATATPGDPFVPVARYTGTTAMALSGSSPSAFDPGSFSSDPWSYLYQSWSDTNRVQTIDDGFTGAWESSATACLLQSAGPDLAIHTLGGVLANDTAIDGPILLLYDPTNGTTSFGSIYRTFGGATPTGYAAGSGLLQAVAAQNADSGVVGWSVY